MSGSELISPVPHSAGTRRPRRRLPKGACDAHMHIFDPSFAPSPHWARKPPDAPVAVYRQLQDRIGTERAVVVTPSTFGTDNACTLDALEQLGDAARGVAVVDTDVEASHLSDLHARGVRGLRVNFVSPQSWGTTTPERLRILAGKIASLPWHIQLFAHAGQLVDMLAMLSALPVPLVIDHLGLVGPTNAAGDAARDAVLRLIDGGSTWIKLSGAYMRSKAGAPSYQDIADWGKALVKHAPDRLLWGSDWPHTTEAPGTVDDADLVDVLLDWCPDEAVLQKVLVDNPVALYGFS